MDGLPECHGWLLLQITATWHEKCGGVLEPKLTPTLYAQNRG